ncbi:Tyramine/octopamine receptor [Strongyloides ratti]|uniref:Tyramine/octopamine receptor n=1 Tax=Strongyloides ratti TaxID=34506 RepID=A0A090LN14_STRRB|nr:Tyramine/octopamine receptor [Strongyloides ratti]CEF71205.1 Tyramine/octopamine receptor [Strongyloides ratti]
MEVNNNISNHTLLNQIIVNQNNDTILKDTIIPLPELILGTITYLVIIAMTVVGNILVVVAVFTYRPLKKVQNYFLVSLACSDLAVATLVMPFHVAKFLTNGRWLFGFTICQFFTTADILLCTSSILNLCAIALDRYWAIHDPLNYAHKRTLKFVCWIIILVWVASVIISVPPIIGWNDWTKSELVDYCELNTEKAFVVFSASGSFFVPLIVMIIVYFKIFLSARQRIRTNRGRSALVKIQKNLNNPLRDDKNKEKHNRRRINFIARSRSFRCSGKKKDVISKVKSNPTDTKSQLLINVNEHKQIENKFSSATLPDSKTTIGPSTSITASGPSHPNKNMVVFQLPNDSKQHNSSTSSSDDKKALDDCQNPTQVLRKREKISVAKEKRAAKTIAVIIFVFTFCWLPFFCAYIILPFCESCYLHPKVLQAFVWLGYINSSLNPFLYGILNLEFRQAFRRILCPKQSLRTRVSILRR